MITLAVISPIKNKKFVSKLIYFQVIQPPISSNIDGNCANNLNLQFTAPKLLKLKLYNLNNLIVIFMQYSFSKMPHQRITFSSFLVRERDK